MIQKDPKDSKVKTSSQLSNHCLVVSFWYPTCSNTISAFRGATSSGLGRAGVPNQGCLTAWSRKKIGYHFSWDQNHDQFQLLDWFNVQFKCFVIFCCLHRLHPVFPCQVNRNLSSSGSHRSSSRFDTFQDGSQWSSPTSTSLIYIDKIIFAEFSLVNYLLGWRDLTSHYDSPGYSRWQIGTECSFYKSTLWQIFGTSFFQQVVDPGSE